MLDVLETALLLGRAPLFAPLDEASLLAIAETAEGVDHPAGAQLIRAGTRGDALLVVVSGRVRVDYPGGTVELGPGDILGELAALDGGPRGSDVIALEATRVISILRDDLIDHLQDRPELVRRVSAIVAHRLAVTT